jgi:hypothetical protein
MQKLLKLEFSKSTKGTHVFSDGDKVSLYFPKDLTSNEGEPLFAPLPKVIHVTVDVE